MKLIRELHKSLKANSRLIIFSENQILYDHSKNTHIFEIKDLNPIAQNGPFIAIA